MFEYIILIALALIVITITFMITKKKKVDKSVLSIVFIGILIAFIAIFIGNYFPFYYTVLIIFGLAFSISILLDKQLKRKLIINQSAALEEVRDEAIEESELQRFVKEETAASVEEEDPVIDESFDDDLEMFMSDAPIDTTSQREEGDRSGK